MNEGGTLRAAHPLHQSEKEREREREKCGRALSIPHSVNQSINLSDSIIYAEKSPR